MYDKTCNVIKHISEKHFGLIESGDKLYIRHNLTVGKYYGDNVFVEGMVKGGVVTSSRQGGSCGLTVVEDDYRYTREMIADTDINLIERLENENK